MHTLDKVQRTEWLNATVRVRQSNLSYDAVVVSLPERNFCRTKAERVAVAPIEKPGIKPKWCGVDQLEFIAHRGEE